MVLRENIETLICPSRSSDMNTAENLFSYLSNKLYKVGKHTVQKMICGKFRESV